MARKKKATTDGGTLTEEPPLPAYDEGHVESVHEGALPPDDTEPGAIPEPTTRGQDPKLADQPDAFISSEVAKDADSRKTS
jgi:hypothetical protein